MVTLRDVAERASVSISTASRILSNSVKETYPEATQVKVLRASLELGYHPNFAARALASGKSHIIAVVFPCIYDTPFTALSSLQILSSIEAFCSDHGYHVLLSSPRIVDGQVDDRFVRLLAGGYPEGIVMDGHFAIDPIVAVTEKFARPMVMLGYHPHPYYLRSDNYLGGQMLMQHLLDLGHEHIGIIGIADGISHAGDQRLAGMCAAFTGDFATLPRIDGNFSAASGAAAARTLLTEHPQLTALIAANDRMAMGAIRELQNIGYIVPDQISVVGFDDVPQSNEFSPALTTVNQRLGDWGALAMHMLVELLADKTPEPVVLEPKLVVRQSSAAPPRSAA
jgi:DNA-binding LacI/PurR family transcriptional regulator